MSRLLRVALVFGLGLAVAAGCEKPPVSTNKDTEVKVKEGNRTITVTAEDPSAKKPAAK